MNKETSSRVSTIAARHIAFDVDNFVGIAEGSTDKVQEFCSDVRSLAASCMSQDETPGQEKPAGDFHTRLKDEREDLDRRLIALNSYLTHNPGKPSPRHNLMLVEQARLMSELLAVIDERLCDIGISERSAPVLAVDNEGEEHAE